MTMVPVEFWRKRNDIWELLRVGEAENLSKGAGYVVSPVWPEDLEIKDGDIMGIRVLAPIPAAIDDFSITSI